MNTHPILVINDQHSLMTDQQRVLDEVFPQGWDVFRVPPQGMNLDNIKDWVDQVDPAQTVIMVSPIPAFFCLLAKRGINFCTLHNDKRAAKEIPDGKGGVKVIHTVAPVGWQVV